DKQELKAGTTESLKVRFSYIENSDKTNYPTENQTFTIAFTMNYTQADNTAVEVPHPTYMYTINMYDDIPPNYNRVFIGQAIPNGITQYNNASEALAAFRLETGDNDISFYLKHMLREGIVEASYIEFVITPAMANESIGVTAGTYAIRGFDTRDLNSPSTNYCKEECYNSTTGKCVNPYFESNNEILTRAFGSHCLLNDETYYCNANGLTVFNYIDGAVIIFDELWLCNVTDFGGSNCNVNIA
ncbi:MAG: hypothetical protein IKE63_02040, partial [Bacilli bacterium]|nr:hypothetical protein [Bacilli bacterium]